MKERPILFSGPMVRAILAGIKTQTRRVVKHCKDRNFGCDLAPHELAGEVNNGNFTNCPYGQPGELLWVREAWRTYASLDHLKPSQIAQGAGVQYEAGGNNIAGEIADRLHGLGRYRSGRFMPRWASRIMLEVTDVRIERLQDISHDDAIAEGVGCNHGSEFARCSMSPQAHYYEVWESIHGAGSWEVNPFVWVLSFKRAPR